MNIVLLAGEHAVPDTVRPGAVCRLTGFEEVPEPAFAQGLLPPALIIFESAGERVVEFGRHRLLLAISLMVTRVS